MNHKIIMLYCFFVAVANSGNAQEFTPITIEKAIELALQNDPNILLADLKVAQNEKLSEAGVPYQPTQLFMSGDEFNFDGISGVQSLNIQQVFNMPSVSKSNKNYYQAKTTQASQQKKLTKKDIIRNIELAYYRLVIAKKEVILSENQAVIYKDFYDRSRIAFESGETNKAPLLSAQTHLKKAQVHIDHALHEVEAALAIFNLWLGTEDKYDVESPLDIDLRNNTIAKSTTNPHVEIYQFEKEVLQQNIEVQKNGQKPQLNTALSLQSIDRDLLFFGYQIGVNILLDRRANNRKVEAIKVGLDMLDAEMKIKQRAIDSRVVKLKSHLEHVIGKIKFYDDELIPVLKEQANFMEEAFRMGEGSYLEYMISVEDINNLQIERLEMLRDFYINLIELKYWTSDF